MRLSVIVPALDEAAGIVATLAALAPLRAAGHEVIVVDGGSRDATAALAAPLADRVLVSARGRALQMNAGAAFASSDTLLFLHADTRLPDDAAAAIAAARAAGRRWGRFDVTIAGRSRALPLVAAMMNRRSRLTGIATGDQALFVERRLFVELGGFPPLPLMEDVALSRTLRGAAGRPACLAQRVVTSGRRWDERGAWRTIAQMWRLRLDYWRGVDPQALARRYLGARAAERPAAGLPSLLIFAKDPVPGAVKTRLAQTIGADEAARIYRELAERVLASAAAARRASLVGEVELCCTPDASSPTFGAWRDRFAVTLSVQQGEDLGARMRNALATALARGAPALVIGTDIPLLDERYLGQAAAALATHDAVIGPAQDGGYVLIGLRRPLAIFDGIGWSTPDVLAQTRARLRDLDATWEELPALWDVDTPEDLARYAALARPAR